MSLEALGFSEVAESDGFAQQATGSHAGAPCPQAGSSRKGDTNSQQLLRDQQPTSPGVATDRDQRSVYVSNLGPSASKDQLFHLFAACGSIVCITIPLNPDTQQPLGHAYIEFASAAEAAAAVHKFNRHRLQGRQLSVQPKRTNIRGYEVFSGCVGFSRRGRRGGRLGATSGTTFGRQGAAFPDWGSG